jgi:osmotically-inducible protein OsmY
MEAARQRAAAQADRGYDHAAHHGTSDMPTGGFQTAGLEGDRAGGAGDETGYDVAAERGLPPAVTEEVAAPFNEEQVLARIDQKGRQRLVAHLDDDERIHDEVVRALARDELVGDVEIDVRVDAGAVTLRGMVESRTVRRRAEDVTEAVRGVAYVQNDLRARDPYFHAADREAPPGIHTGHDPAAQLSTVAANSDAPPAAGDTAIRRRSTLTSG